MHPIFNTEELVRHIFYSASTTGALASLALVQKGLGSTALDILWENVAIHAIFYLFPSDVVSLHSQAKFVKVPRRSDWERFAVYSPRVKKLRRDPLPYTGPRNTAAGTNMFAFEDRPTRSADVENALFFLRHYPSGIPFPNLQYLAWNGALVYELPDLSMFIVPSLHTVDLSGVTFKGNPSTNTYRLSLSAVIEAPLRALADLESCSLRKLSAPIPHGRLHTEYLTACSSLMRDGLVDITIPLSVELLSVLGSVQTLRALTLRFPRRDALDENTRQWLEKPNSSSGAYEGTQIPFGNLKTLSVRHAPSLQVTTSVITKARCYSMEGINIKCYAPPNRDEFSELLARGLHPSCSTTLREFSLVAKRSPTGNLPPGWGHQAVSDSESESSVEERDEVINITVECLQPFQSFQALEVLIIDPAYHFVTDAQLKDLVSAFPLITELGLCTQSSGHFLESDTTAVTIHGLSALASCPQLRKFGVYLNIRNQDLLLPPVALPGPNSLLTELNVGSSFIPEGCITHLTLFLVHNFPNIKKIIWRKMSSRSNWPEVSHGLECAQMYRRHYQTHMLDLTLGSS